MGPNRFKSSLKSSKSLWGRAKALAAKKATTQNTWKNSKGKNGYLVKWQVSYLGQHVSIGEKCGQLLVDLTYRRAFIVSGSSAENLKTIVLLRSTCYPSGGSPMNIAENMLPLLLCVFLRLDD